jgi:hypothetical protein
VDLVQGAIMPPLVEIPPHGALVREVLGDIAPLNSSPPGGLWASRGRLAHTFPQARFYLAAGAEDVGDGGDDVPQVGLARMSAGADGEVRLDQRPLRVGDVAAGVRSGSHTLFYEFRTPLMGQTPRRSRDPIHSRRQLVFVVKVHQEQTDGREPRGQHLGDALHEREPER